MGICHHIRFMSYWGSNPRLHECQADTLPTELHPHPQKEEFYGMREMLPWRGWALPVLVAPSAPGAWHTVALPCWLSAAAPAMTARCSAQSPQTTMSVCWMEESMCCLRPPTSSLSPIHNSPMEVCREVGVPCGHLSCPAVVCLDDLQKLLLLGLFIGTLRDLGKWQRGESVLSDHSRKGQTSSRHGV